MNQPRYPINARNIDEIVKYHRDLADWLAGKQADTGIEVRPMTTEEYHEHFHMRFMGAT